MQADQTKEFIHQFPGVQPCPGEQDSIRCRGDLGRQTLSMWTLGGTLGPARVSPHHPDYTWTIRSLRKLKIKTLMGNERGNLFFLVHYECDSDEQVYVLLLKLHFPRLYYLIWRKRLLTDTSWPKIQDWRVMNSVLADHVFPWKFCLGWKSYCYH